MLKLKVFPLILLLLFSLYACSRVQLAYNQLDWLIPYYINGYVELTDNQDNYLNEQVNALLNWHCSEHLASYAQLLRDANQRFQSGTITTEQLQNYEAQIDQYWREIMQHISPSLIQLFHGITDEQVIGLRERFAADNRNWQEAFNEMTAEEIQDENLEIMQGELERWFDELNEQQLKLVYSWSREFETLGLEGLHTRERWQRRLLSLLESRQDLEQLSEGVRVLFVTPKKLRSVKYLERTQNNKKVTFQLIYRISKSLSREQLQYLDSMMTTVAGDFDSLACNQTKLVYSRPD